MENEYLKYYLKKEDKLYNSDKKQVLKMQNDTKKFKNFKKQQILHNKSLLKLINDCTRFGKAVTKLAINVS